MWALLDKGAHERRRQRMDLHSERLEAKLNAVDGAVRDVLVGTVRSPQQLDICRRHRFYYIPAEQLGDEAFSVRIVALYQSQYVFGPQASSTTARSRSAARSAGATSRSFGHGRGQSRTFIIALRSGNGSG